MKVRLLLLSLVAVLATAGAFTSPATAAPPTTTAISIPISPAQSGGILNGVFTLTSFSVNSAGQLVANGVFTGTVTIGGVTQTITTTVSAVLTPAGSCRILDLTLGPLHLDLLGLVVDLNQVHLTVTAVPGPGNLLGNLLCAVANLLNSNAGPTALQQLVDLLNQIVARL
jgi:hypothetical protein